MKKTLMCDPALLSKDLSGRVYIVTGANSGVGLATTRQLVRQGAHVVAACRRVVAGRRALGHLQGERGSYAVMELDLADLDSVRQFVSAFMITGSQLDGLVNNAGVMLPGEGRTKDGFEIQFGVNYLGHFLLSELLLEALKASAPSRVVCVSSSAHVGVFRRPATVDLEDPFFENRPYRGLEAYAQSKLAIVIYARHLAKRLAGTGVSVFSTHPGLVRTNLIENFAPRWIQDILMRPLWKPLGMISPEEGAQTQLHCLLADDAPAHSGEYFAQRNAYPLREDRAGGWPMRSPNPNAYDDVLARRLYEFSARVVGLTPDPAVVGWPEGSTPLGQARERG